MFYCYYLLVFSFQSYFPCTVTHFHFKPRSCFVLLLSLKIPVFRNINFQVKFQQLKFNTNQLVFPEFSRNEYQYL